MKDLMRHFLNCPIIDILLSYIDYLTYNSIDNKMTIYYKNNEVKTIKCSFNQYTALNKKLNKGMLK